MAKKLIITSSSESDAESSELPPTQTRLNPMESLEAYKAQLQVVAQLLKKRFSQVPFYAAKAARDPSFWENWAESRINYS